MKKHPCQKCGACCSYFRVSFHWSETLLESYHVPIASTVNVSLHQNAMAGTNQKNPRCVEFSGVVGKNVNCDIYENRPSCCRLFEASFENGAQNLECEKARKSKGLNFLTLEDWPYKAATKASTVFLASP